MTKRTSPVADREQRRVRVAELLLSGNSYREIGREICVSTATVQRDVALVLGRWREECLETIDDHVRQDLKRIDLALQGIANDVKAGTLPAIDRWIRLLDHRAKLLGLYEPARVQADVRVNYLDQVRDESAVIAEYEEVVQDAARRIINTGQGPAGAGNSATSLEGTPELMGQGQSRNPDGSVPISSTAPELAED
jgi:hypothetical protein